MAGILPVVSLFGKVRGPGVNYRAAVIGASASSVRAAAAAGMLPLTPKFQA